MKNYKIINIFNQNGKEIEKVIEEYIIVKKIS